MWSPFLVKRNRRRAFFIHHFVRWSRPDWTSCRFVRGFRRFVRPTIRSSVFLGTAWFSSDVNTSLLSLLLLLWYVDLTIWCNYKEYDYWMENSLMSKLCLNLGLHWYTSRGIFHWLLGLNVVHVVLHPCFFLLLQNNCLLDCTLYLCIHTHECICI